MKYTVRYAHLDKAPEYKKGDTILRGEEIGIIGTSGQSTGIHLHIDCVEGIQDKRYTLADLTNGSKIPSKKQLDYFIDNELFGIIPVITTKYDDIEYFEKYRKWHKAYDIVPEDRKQTMEHYAIHWNRSKVGTVQLVVYEPSAYGNCIYISFDA